MIRRGVRRDAGGGFFDKAKELATSAAKDAGLSEESAASIMKDLFNKAVGNPKLTSALNKAMRSRKIKDAVVDCKKNGRAAIKKYIDDEEIHAILKELKSLF